jgi:hypothetical protein
METVGPAKASVAPINKNNPAKKIIFFIIVLPPF